MENCAKCGHAKQDHVYSNPLAVITKGARPIPVCRGGHGCDCLKIFEKEKEQGPTRPTRQQLEKFKTFPTFEVVNENGVTTLRAMDINLFDQLCDMAIESLDIPGHHSMISTLVKENENLKAQLNALKKESESAD